MILATECDGCGKTIDINKDNYCPVIKEKIIDGKKHTFLLEAYCEKCEEGKNKK